VLINSSNQIWVGIAGNNSLSGTLGPIAPGEDYVFILTFTGEQVLTASVHNMAGTVLFELERSVAGLGDATPGLNASVFGSGASNYVAGELGTFKTNPGSVNYPVRVSSCSRFRSSGGRFYNTLGTVAYYNSTDCVSYEIWSYQTKYGGNIQSGCKDTGFVNAVAIDTQLTKSIYLCDSCRPNGIV
jgi:hypothetical protein